MASDAAVSMRVSKVIREISGVRRGAFLLWTRHPMLQSVALPTGGLGVLSLLNALL